MGWQPQTLGTKTPGCPPDQPGPLWHSRCSCIPRRPSPSPSDSRTVWGGMEEARKSVAKLPGLPPSRFSSPTMPPCALRSPGNLDTPRELQPYRSPSSGPPGKGWKQIRTEVQERGSRGMRHSPGAAGLKSSSRDWRVRLSGTILALHA